MENNNLIRKHVLEKAVTYTCSDRAAEYGTPEENFTAIAKLWSCWLGVEISAHDVAIMMTLLKIGRMKTGVSKDDTYIDACGYLAIGAEIVLSKGEWYKIVGEL